MASPIIDHLLTRSSAPIPELKAPAPSDAEIETILTAATRVPDHGRLAPWRFILYRGATQRKNRGKAAGTGREAGRPAA